MKSKIVSILCVLGILGWSVGCWRQESTAKLEKEEADKGQRAKQDARNTDLVRKYHAIFGWENRINKGSPYSLEIQDALVNEAGNPILIRRYWLEDVAQQGDKSFLIVEVARGDWSIRFVLECDSSIARRIAETRPHRLSRNATIVAKIDSITKAGLKLTSGVVRGMDEEPPIEADTADLFFARGRCVDIDFDN